jgi:predicted RNA-binding protein
MCLASAYTSERSEEPFMREIAHVRLDGDRIEIETLLGDTKTVRGRISEIDFMGSRITIEEQLH